jgi:hypothetical protein
MEEFDVKRIYKNLEVFRSYMLLFITMLVISSCAASNPIAVAETPGQKAYAIERTYNIVLAGALDLVNDPAVSQGIKSNIRSVEKRTTPIVSELSEAFTAYTVARAQFDAGQSTQERLAVVARNLDNWITQAERALIELAAAVN